MDQEVLTIKVRGEDGHRNITVRIKERTLQGIEQIVKDTGHSRNEIIGLMLDYALPRIKIEAEEP